MSVLVSSGLAGPYCTLKSFSITYTEHPTFVGAYTLYNTIQSFINYKIKSHKQLGLIKFVKTILNESCINLQLNFNMADERYNCRVTSKQNNCSLYCGKLSHLIVH